MCGLHEVDLSVLAHIKVYPRKEESVSEQLQGISRPLNPGYLPPPTPPPPHCTSKLAEHANMLTRS